MRTVGHRTRRNGPRRVRGACSYCGAVWESDRLRLDESGNYVCPLEGPGRDIAALDQANIDSMSVLQEDVQDYHGPAYDESTYPEAVNLTTRDDVLGS